MSNIIKIVATLRAKPGKGQHLKQVLLACVEGSRAEPGCLFYDLHVDRSDAERFVFIEGHGGHRAPQNHRALSDDG